jgi:hypothetical protein
MSLRHDPWRLGSFQKMDRCAHDLSAIGIPRFKKGAFHIRTSKLAVPRRLKYFSKKDSKLGAVDYGIALGSFFF